MRWFLCLWPALLGMLSTVVSGEEYYGVEIGPLRQFAHKIKGMVYAAGEDTIFIKDFSYDGRGPDAFFWIGSSTDNPSPEGILLPYPDDGAGTPRVLQSYDNADIILRLPPGKKVQDMKWLSIWCRRFTVDFGNVLIPRGLKPPKTVRIGELSRLGHKVQSDEIVILNTKTFYIPNFHYDGGCPDAFFWVGTGPEPSPNGDKVSDERGSDDPLRGYNGQDIEITLSEDTTVYEIDWLSVWCVKNRRNLGSVRIPRDLSNLPPYLEQPRTQEQSKGPAGGAGVASQLTNCRPFVNYKMLVRWGSDSQNVYVQLSGEIEENEWLGFGISGDPNRPKMEGGDVVVAFYDSQDGTYRVEDYYMTHKSQCSGQTGVCPDATAGGRNDAQVISGTRRNGVTTIAFKRPLAAGDSSWDKRIPSYGDVQVIAAIGTLNTRKEANYHSIGRDGGRIDFSAQNDNQCGGLDTGRPAIAVVNTQPWEERYLSGVDEFVARIGPTGGRRGYEAVTNAPSWGIAWWINGLLIPEIYVKRGRTYTFVVEGGDDPSNPAQYHPLYITSDPEGGYASKNQTYRSRETVYAGVNFNAIGGPTPTAVGRLCKYEPITVDRKDQVATFEEYRDTLRVQCTGAGQPGRLTWTVEPSTPDLVYYQCYTHRHLGWKIHVLDADSPDGVREGRRQEGGGGAALAAAAKLLPLAMLGAALLS